MMQYGAATQALNTSSSKLNNLMKGEAPRKHILHEKKAASVLSKLFISGNEGCHTTDAPIAWAELFQNVNNIQSMIPEDQKM